MGVCSTAHRCAFWLLLVGVTELRATPAWQCFLDDLDVSATAQPRVISGEILLNVSRIAPHLNWQVHASGRHLEIIDSTGSKWNGEEASPTLTGALGILDTAHPPILEGSSAYLTISAIKRLADLEVLLDHGRKRIQLTRRRAPVLANEVLSGGWETFTLQKTAAERGTSELSAIPTARRIERATSPPPAADVIRIDATQGYIVRGDAGTEFSVSGKVNGFTINSNTLLTLGSEGLVPLSGRVTLNGRRDDWWLVGGDMFSDIWGLARGVRYSKELGRGHRPSLSMYLRSRRDGEDRPTFSLMDEYTFARTLTVGGEVNSDSSYFAKATMQISNLSMHGFYRNARIAEGKSQGASIAYSFFDRISLQGRLTKSGAGINQVDLRNGSIRFGLPAGTDLTLDYTELISPLNRQRIAAGMLGIPAGPVRLRLRYQARDQIIRPEPGLNLRELRSLQHEAFLTATYFKNHMLSFDYQMAQRWRRDGSLEAWNQMIATLRLDRRTDFQAVFGIPDIANPNQFRVRAARWLRDDVSFAVDYGNVPMHQATALPIGDRVFRVGFRKIFNVKSPAHGGRLSGRVIDVLDQPFEGVLVRLGPYSAATDKTGKYEFRNVPAGSYQLSVDRETLPANYTVSLPARPWRSTGDSHDTIDIVVTALGSLQGLVYVDEDGNAKADAGEGIERIAIECNGRFTASRPDGRFGFHNLDPGVYDVRIVRERIPSEFELVGPERVQVEISNKNAGGDVQFRLKRRTKSVIFQELP